MESNRDLSLSSCVQHLQRGLKNLPEMSLSSHALGRESAGPVVLSATQINCACMMRPWRSEWVQVRVCLEELSIVFGPRTSALCFFSGLQETWPPCAEEPFGTGQWRGNGGGGGHSVKIWVIFKLKNNPPTLQRPTVKGGEEGRVHWTA